MPAIKSSPARSAAVLFSGYLSNPAPQNRSFILLVSADLCRNFAGTFTLGATFNPSPMQIFDSTDAFPRLPTTYPKAVGDKNRARTSVPLALTC
jgi:hypothetical protein